MAIGWRVELGSEWNVLGPFPIQAREQHYISPAFPIVNLSQPIEFSKYWPSAYADNGHVFWSKATAESNGTVKVSFPEIRWKSLRATEGWAALQHHSLLHTTLTVYPPTSKEPLPGFRFNLIQGSYFTILPTDASKESYVPEWFMGNIYDLRDALPRSVSLPSPPSETEPTQYDIFVSGDYEIRLFGDPNARGSEVPELVIQMTVETESVEDPVVHEPSQDVLCDFIDDIPFGNVLGIALRSKRDWWTVTSISAINNQEMNVNLDSKYRIAPGQTRIIPLLANNEHFNGAFKGSELMLTLNIISSTSERRLLLIKLPIRHVPHWRNNPHQPIIGTYLYASSMPTAFAVVPPAKSSADQYWPFVYGAGVEAIKDPFWIEALPKRERNWYVVPQGRSSWGLDWHGPSAKDAWGAVDALYEILAGCEQWQDWQIEENARVILMGHSNGGQGTWYIAARYPDRVIAAIPAAAYVKSQGYIPLHMSRSAHFIDPSLRAILESSLTPDDNDLHLSNLRDVPILAIHGGDDENVPVWHSRQLVDILESQSNQSNVQYCEIKGKGHFWSTVFLTDEVQAFLDRYSAAPFSSNTRPHEFTLTAASPQEFGSLHGFRIESLLVSGRIGRLHVTVDATRGTANVRASNVLSFSVRHRPSFCTTIVVDQSSFPTHFSNEVDRLYFTMSHYEEHKWWEITTSENRATQTRQAPSRLQTVLSSDGPIGIIFARAVQERSLSAALRIAHDLFLYHKLDSYLIQEDEAQAMVTTNKLENGNLLYIGTPGSDLARSLLGQKQTAFSSDAGKLFIDGRAVADPSMGTIFIHPHPDHGQPDNSMTYVLGYNDPGLERGLRLFPIRTGIPVPSWVISTEGADRQGAGGIIGAGVWNRNWKYEEAMCMQQY